MSPLLLIIAALLRQSECEWGLSFALGVVFLTSTFHHWNLESRRINTFTSFTLDCIAQAAMIAVLLHVSPTCSVVSACTVAAAYLVALSTFVRYQWVPAGVCSLCMGIMYMTLLAINARLLSMRTWIHLPVVVAAFVLGNINRSLYRILWPCLHVACISLLASFLVDLRAQ